MAPVLLPDELGRTITALDDRIKRLERSSNLGMGASTAGTTVWQDANGATQVSIGLEPDGTYAVWIGTGANQIKLQATGPNAGQILGLAILALSGALTVGGLLNANGGIQIPLHQGQTNVAAAGSNNGMTIFTGVADPAASAGEGDLWFKDSSGGVYVRRSGAWNRVI